MNHGLFPIDHIVTMRVAAGSELKMVNSKKSEKLDSKKKSIDNLILIFNTYSLDEFNSKIFVKFIVKIFPKILLE